MAVLAYTPSIAGNAIFGIVYETIAVLLTINLFKRRDWWGLCLPIGAFCQGIGFFLRIALAQSTFSLSLYIPEEFFTVLSPACYLAFNYIWFGRLCQRYEEYIEDCGTKHRKHITFLSPRKFGLIFIVSDVTTFLIQAGGGGMQVNEGLQNVGSIIFLFGIIAQFVSYLFFLALSIPVLRSMSRLHDQSGGCASVRATLRHLFLILYFSSVWIIVRSIYRTVELAQGFGGPLSQREAYFFGLDSAPLIVAISTYVFFWPSSFLELKDHQTATRYNLPWEAGKYVNQLNLSHRELPLSSSSTPQGMYSGVSKESD